MSWTAGVVTLVSGCAPSHTMQQSPDDGSCPARYMASTSASQTDAEARNVLTWSGPAETRDVEQNNVWCRTVGRPVFRALPRLRLEEAIRVDSVAVLTWNINLGGGDVVAFLTEDTRPMARPRITWQAMRPTNRRSWRWTHRSSPRKRFLL